MASNDKPQTEDVFCLYHQKIQCNCIAPVTDTPTLTERLQHHIRLNEILNRHEPDAAVKESRNHQTILLENRLHDLLKT